MAAYVNKQMLEFLSTHQAFSFHEIPLALGRCLPYIMFPDPECLQIKRLVLLTILVAILQPQVVAYRTRCANDRRRCVELTSVVVAIAVLAISPELKVFKSYFTLYCMI
jgi:hypothetical protein